MPEEPVFRRIAREITEAIERGDFEVGDWLPKNRDLATQYGVSVSTVQSAIRLLEDREIVTTHQGKASAGRVKSIPPRPHDVPKRDR